LAVEKNFMIFLIWSLKSILVIGLGTLLFYILSAISIALIGSGGLVNWGMREKTASFLSAF